MEILIFGSGRTSKNFLRILSNDVNLIGFSDNNQALHKKKFYGKIVYPPSEISELDFDYIIVASMHYNEIIKQLTEFIGVPREKILVFIGTRTLKSMDNDNDTKLRKLLKKPSYNKIGFSLSDVEGENCILKDLYEKIPACILERYEVESFNYKEQRDCGIVIHQKANCMSNYLVSTNIALWRGLSFKEISQMRDIPNDYILKGAYIHGVSYIILKGDYSNKLPCVSWDITSNKLTVLGIPSQDIKQVETIKNRSCSKVIYIPSAFYKLDSEMPVMDCSYIEPYIKELLDKKEKLKFMGIDFVIALPDSDLSSLRIKQNANVRFIPVGSDYFYNDLAMADIVITDNSISALEYIMFGNMVINLILDTPNYQPPKEYILKGYESSPLAHSVNSIDELLNLLDKLLKSGDDYVKLRRIIMDDLCFCSNDVLSKRIWDEIANCFDGEKGKNEKSF